MSGIRYSKNSLQSRSMFDPVNPHQSFPDLERGILEYWQEEDIFRRSIKQRKGAKSYSFYDGPPFATGLPHYGHLLAGTIKDVIPRYRAMRGDRVERRFGWDCHGLPVEYEIEKEHKIKNRRDIEQMGTKAFNGLCRGIVQRYTKEWRTTVERMGRWVDMDNDYKTMDPNYMESIWWVFHTLYEKGLLYEGWKPMHICPRCATPLSNFEVTQGYKDRTDQSVIVTFPLIEDARGKTQETNKKQETRVNLLAWTTTPWSLPGNFWLAVGSHITYAKVREGDAIYILAEKLVPTVFKGREYVVEGTLTAKEIVGKRYEPLFPYFQKTHGDRVFKVIMNKNVEVSDEEGTGIVHLTSSTGEDSNAVATAEKVEVLPHVRIDGTFIDAVTDFAGMNAKPEGKDPMATDKAIISHLKKHSRVFDAYSITHSYPHCWRCETPLLPYTTSSWFVSVEKIKEDMLLANKETQWVPAHLRDGRFGKWLENARDWAISRNRYWGTPLPIWRCDETKEIEVIGSRDDLMAHVPNRFTKVTVLRHGESEGNLVPLYQATVPGTPLTTQGLRQAKLAGEFLKDQKVDIIYCSPIERTHQTAQAIADATGAKIVVDDRLRELGVGPYEGQTIPVHDLDLSRTLRMEKYRSKGPQSIFTREGMEPWDDIQKRMNSFFDETLGKHKGEHIVVVSHGEPIYNIQHYFTKEDPYKIAQVEHVRFATPHAYFWDHEQSAEVDLHKEIVDDVTWKDRSGNTFRRVPDVLDCWFESGSMPYAQENFPFSFVTNRSSLPIGFPADFIAEGIDQTRGWFYTLTVLSAALFKKPAFFNCVVNGTVLAEDGRKMSKRLKNYPDPSVVIEKYGAAALRFALMNSPAVRGEDVRFSESVVEEALRNVLLPLWNSFSFFVTYANAAKFEAAAKPRSSEHPLDLWIRAEVQDLVNRMTAQLDAYDLSATCSELFETIDALTNWYIRLSRRRFAGKDGADDDKHSALQTLSDVLVTLSQLLAPFCPFMTEEIYLNLIHEEHGSIHLTDWPAVRALTNEEKHLLAKNRTMRKIVSLGLKIRSKKNIKTRQPLNSAIVALPPSMGQLVAEDIEILKNEMNVKSLTFKDDPTILGAEYVEVNARKVGPRLGALVQEVIAAGKRGEFLREDDGSILILDERLTKDEVNMKFSGKEDQDVIGESGIVVGIETRISKDLKAEGLARDLIRQIQRLRKEKGYEMGTTVTIGIEGVDSSILNSYRALIEAETSVSIRKESGQKNVVEIADGKKVTIFMENA